MIKCKTRKIGHSIGLTSGLFSKQIVSNDYNARDVYIELYIRDHACRFFLSFVKFMAGVGFLSI